nr:unnamed protein product [Digitaria exilis]
MGAAKCSPATLLPFVFLLLLPPMATCREEMESVYVGKRVLPVRLGRPAFGPESLAFDHRGDGPYTGVSNGRVLRWRGPLRGWTEFAHNYKHEPLGLQFHGASGDLYFADAYLGLMRVGRRGGLAEAVVTEAGGAPLNFANGVDVDQDTGHVYFTDSSATFQRSDYMMIILTHDATGRLLRYDPATGSTAVLASNLSFPNGVALSGDGTHLVVAETARCRLLRHWLRGLHRPLRRPSRLPGQRDYYWVALNKDKPRSVAAVRVRAADGAVVEALRGLGNATLSEVVERPGGALWLGSVDTPYVGLFRSGP